MFDQLIEMERKRLVDMVREIVKIPSIAGRPVNKKPLGEGPASALQAVLNIAGDMGFYTKNLDNYIGFAEYGEGDEYIAVLGHLDTVPPGEHWTYPPFGGKIHGGKIYGRGTLDDKGPIMSALVSLKVIRDSRVKLDRRIRVIFGLDEETGDRDIAHYLLYEKPPVQGFTPDSDFPVVFAEKGILHVELGKKIPAGPGNSGRDILQSFNGGEAVNMVPDMAIAKIKSADPEVLIRRCDEFSIRSGFLLFASQEGDIVTIRSDGISAHGSRPDKGKNAVMQLNAFLATIDFGPGEAMEMIRFLDEKIGIDTTGYQLGIGLADEPSGHLTLNVGRVSYQEREILISVDIRYPVTETADNVLDNITRALEEKEIHAVVKKHQVPLYYPPDSDLIRTLRQIYCEVTGDKKGPVAIGGGTYARRLPNIVAFGPYLPGIDNSIHAADESIGCEELVTLTKIYARAMYTLAKGR